MNVMLIELTDYKLCPATTLFFVHCFIWTHFSCWIS